MIKTAEIITDDIDIVYMKDMKPLEVGIIQDNPCAGTIVMRTAYASVHASVPFEVINLSDPGPNKCWTIVQNDGETMRVKLIRSGKLIITI